MDDEDHERDEEQQKSPPVSLATLFWGALIFIVLVLIAALFDDNRQIGFGWERYGMELKEGSGQERYSGQPGPQFVKLKCSTDRSRTKSLLDAVDKGETAAVADLMFLAERHDSPFAHYQLSLLYIDGDGVAQSWERSAFHMYQAALLGHPSAFEMLVALGADDEDFSFWLGCLTKHECEFSGTATNFKRRFVPHCSAEDVILR